MSLGLPSQDYYLNPSSKKDKEAYYKLMVDIAILLGAEYDYAQQQMQQVLNFETKLANVSQQTNEKTFAILNPKFNVESQFFADT